MKHLFLSLGTGIFLVALATSAKAQTAGASSAADVPSFKVRPGYHVDPVAQNIGEVRFLEFGDADTLYVSQPRAGSIITLREHDGCWNKIAEFTTGKPTVHGLCFHDGWLWFTQSGAVWKARDTDGDGRADEEMKITDALPSNGTHWWRSILVTPSCFYTSIGDSGNITDELSTERQKIWRFNLDGSGKTLFASGLRNTEKLRLRPGTGEIWGVDHGSDGWGRTLGEQRGNQPFTDHLPGEKINHYVEGAFYGHPFIVGNGLPRLEFKDRPDFLEWANKTTLPAWTLPAHWAPNGWNFMQRGALGMQGDIVVACHGSWNSSVRVGYRVERVMFDPVTGQPMGNQMLVSALGDDQQILGRPCDIAEASDGSIYFSDDGRGRIYRLSRDGSDAKADAAQTQRIDIVPGVTVAASKVGAIQAAAQLPTVFRPLDYFQNQCARCHGDYGATYGSAFRGKLDDRALRDTVLAMTEGPAQAPITATQREALTGFLRALRDDHPYAVILSNEAGTFTGEASPGSKIWVEDHARTVAVTLNGHAWQTRVPPETDLKDAFLHVQKNGRETVIPLAGGAGAGG